MAIHFTNTLDKLTFASIQAAQAQAQTFSCWCYCDAITISQWIFVILNSGGSDGVLFYLYTNAKDLQVFIHTDDVNMFQRTADAVWNTGEWFHLLYTWDGSLTAANIHIYVNNVETSYDTERNGTGSFTACDGDWGVGQNPGGNLALDGKIANVGWWDRVLSASERTILFKNYSPRCIMKGLKFAPDLIRETQDPISGLVGALTGTEAFPHPRTILPY